MHEVTKVNGGRDPLSRAIDGNVLPFVKPIVQEVLDYLGPLASDCFSHLLSPFLG